MLNGKVVEMIARISLMAALASLGHITVAEAQDLTGARQACMADYSKHCANVRPGGGRVKKCLTENLDKLTADCKAAVIANTNASKEKG